MCCWDLGAAKLVASAWHVGSPRLPRCLSVAGCYTNVTSHRAASSAERYARGVGASSDALLRPDAKQLVRGIVNALANIESEGYWGERFERHWGRVDRGRGMDGGRGEGEAFGEKVPGED